MFIFMLNVNLQLCVQIIKGVACWLLTRLAGDTIHNRTANRQGGPGKKKLPMDRVCEFLNLDFKGKLYVPDALKCSGMLHFSSNI